jgi:hypothetical protein
MRIHPFLAASLVARLAAAQTTVSGIVRDSIANAPLAGATVQLVSRDGANATGRTTTSDELGRFQIRDVADGRYQIGFFHPLLDSLGVEPSVHEIIIAGRRAARIDLATPSGSELRAAFCGTRTLGDSNAVIVGVVRDARTGAPLTDANVTADWLEYTFAGDGISRRTPHVDATTRSNGWFALCGLPRGGTIVLSAHRSADSTGRIELDVPANGFRRRELYLGPVRTVVERDTTAIIDSLPLRRVRRFGDGRLRGLVLSALGNRPLPGAQVGIADGPQTRANERGEWTLVDVPFGTQSLEVRALGHYPERVPVDVVPEAEPIQTAMRTMKAVLDTVRVVEARMNNPKFAEFEQRRRSGAGRYITLADIERLRPFTTSDIFKMMPGVRFERVGAGGIVMVRGVFAPWCVPSVFIDGMNMGQIPGDEIDALANPDEIAGIEVYSGTNVPAQFRGGLAMSPGGDACGAIVVWTRMRPSRRRQWTLGKAAVALGAIAGFVAAGSLLTRR